MSTPIQHSELSPQDPKFYAPPRWRSGAVDASPIQPSPRVTQAQASERDADLISPAEEVHLDDQPMAYAVSAPTACPDSGIRTKTFAIAAAVVAWTGFCVVLGLGRLDPGILAQLRNDMSFATKSERPVSEAAQIASLEILQATASSSENLSQALTPTLAVADAIGETNAALPLAIKASNYPDGTTIKLAGLVAGTTLSAGAAVGETQWRVAVDDLPNAQVIPPVNFSGAMTIMAELHTSDDEVVVRTSLQLTWRPAAIKVESPVVVKDNDSADVPKFAAPPASDENGPKEQSRQALAWQKDSAVSQASSRGKRKYVSRHARKRQHSSPALVMETDTVSRWRAVPSSNYSTSAYSDVRADRKHTWGDFQSVIDRSWDRCKYDCSARR